MKTIFMKLKQLVCNTVMLLCFMNSYAQDTLGISISTDSLPPHASAILELRHAAKGFLPTRLSTTQKEQINNPAKGLLVYDTTLQQYSFFKDSAWQVLGGGDVWQSQNNHIHYSSGLVGIGTDSASHQLEVSGNVLVYNEGAMLMIDTNLLGMGVSGLGAIKTTVDSSGMAVVAVIDNGYNGLSVAAGYVGGDDNNYKNIFLNIDSSRISLSNSLEGVYTGSLNIENNYVGMGYYDQTNANNYSSIWANNGQASISRRSGSSNTQSGAYFNDGNLNISVTDNDLYSTNSNVYLNKNSLSFTCNKSDTVSNITIDQNSIALNLYGNNTHYYNMTFNRNGSIYSNMNIQANTISTNSPQSPNGSGTWKLGKKVSATVQLVTTDYIEVEIDGVIYKLALVQ